jgi:hypothetical protein
MGTIEADTKEEASEKLRAKDWFIMSLEPEGEAHKMVLEHGRVPEEDQDDDEDVINPDVPNTPEDILIEQEQEPVSEEVEVTDGDREPFGDDVTLDSIRQAMRVAGVSWDSDSGTWLFRRISFDKDGKQVSRWLPAMEWMANRLEDAKASSKMADISRELSIALKNVSDLAAKLK